MKRNIKHNIFGWLALSTSLLATSCAGISDLDVENRRVSGTNTVTFTVQSQSQTAGMRAAGDLNTRNQYISTGQETDVLIFAVYEKQSDGTYSVAEEYGKNYTGAVYKGKKGDGQTVMDVSYKDGGYPLSLQFTFDVNKTYKVAFWAQNGSTVAYDTQDLQKVKVNYQDANQKNFLNNTENRDAFCAVSDDITGETKQTQTITLRRPLAQINVGTAGWDYEGAAVLLPGSVSYTQSMMKLSGVARYYDVLNGKTLTSSDLGNGDGDATTDVTFDYYRLPAFINVDSTEWSKPQIAPYIDATQDKGQEEFLTVDINKNDTIEAYHGWDYYYNYQQTDEKFLENGTLPDTEQFKYLSMCYVLVPEASTTPEASQIQAIANGTEIAGNANGTGSTVNVEFTFKGTEINDDKTYGTANAKEFVDTYKVNNVPVQKNWRTNLLSKNFFTYSTEFKLDIVPQYCGDYIDTLTISGSWPSDTTKVEYSYGMDFNTKNEMDGTVTLPVGGEISGHEKNQNKDGFFTFTDWDFPSKDTTSTNWHAHATLSNVKYEGKSYDYGLNMQGCTAIQFKVKGNATLTIVQQAKSKNTDPTKGIRLWKKGSKNTNGEDYPSTYAKQPNDNNNSNINVYTIELSAGTYQIRRGLREDKNGDTSDGSLSNSSLVYVKVEGEYFSFTPKDGTINEDGKFNDEYGNDYNPDDENDKDD